jgi:prepilin-type N-terminal cleavage/methylation domain-containing protein
MLNLNITKTVISKPKFTTGFTIIEVLVVIGIIAILTVLIFPSLNDIRKKNRDTERVADISAIQLALSLYKSQATSSSVYPVSLDGDDFQKFVAADSLTDPDGDPYFYVPLAKSASKDKCTFYHLGAELELTSAQVDGADSFDSTTEGGQGMNGYYWCTGYGGPGIAPGSLNYNVHP